MIPTLRALALSPLLAALSTIALLPVSAFAENPPAAAAANEFLGFLKNAPARVIAADGTNLDATTVKLVRDWNGDLCHATLTNTSDKPVVIDEVVMFDFPHGLPATTPIYAEGFQKLAMNGGTLGQPRDLGAYSDHSHYKIPEPEGMRTAYGLFTTAPAGAERILIASTSCNKFISRFSYDKSRLRVSFDCEKLTLAPGETWKLEEIIAVAGPDREKLFDRLSEAVSKNHKRLDHDIPAGWCSWICFGPGVTAKNVSDVSAWIAKNEPRLKYIQIDDGYQPWMGDWLESGKTFGGGVQKVLKQIKDDGLEPAIWVAPFIASPQSNVFKEHPDWFVKDTEGKPLASNKIGFGGWRQGPWYVLDGTHPEAQKHLTRVFKTMREQWGVTYFKLDANYWGAMHGGVHFDKNATRIEAYRRGMEAVLKGSGDAFVLGCNHPLWPSFGLIHGSRSSMDIAPSWNSFASIAAENMHRAWQNGRFWWNDPDTVLLDDRGAKDIMDNGGEKVIGKSRATTENEFLFHATSIYAAGGLILSGDDLTKISPAHFEILKKLLPPTGVAARFPDEKFEVGEIFLKGETVYAVMNRENKPAARTLHLKTKSKLVEKLTGKDLGVHEGDYVIPDFPAHCGMLIGATPAK